MIPLQKLNKMIVDLKKSGVDKEKSNPAKGEYVFKNPKVYYKKSDRPDYVIKWCVMQNSDNNNPMIPLTEAWKYQYGFDFVKSSEFDYAVESIRPNGDGYFRVGDAVLMKIPTAVYVEKVIDERKAHDAQLRQQKTSWHAQLKKDGAVIKDDMVSDILGVAAEPQK